jgi:Family of unknown function (DUF5706)
MLKGHHRIAPTVGRGERATLASEDESLEYARSLYASIVDWYKDAHGRAQLLLTVDGAFITFLAGVVLANRSDLHITLDAFGPETWTFLGLMAVGFAISGGAALLALMPRRLGHGKIDQDYWANDKADRRMGLHPAPSNMWYSEFIIKRGREEFIADVAAMDKTKERVALASQIYVLSKGLGRKYRGVFVGYVATGIALLMLLLATTDYLIRA